MKDIKCSCGHVSPPGTSICESCGNPLDENQNQLLNMRYEGMARRSQLQSKNLLDMIWSFFSSVRNAVWMIVITLIAAIIGTILPQDEFKLSSLPASQFYPETYGWLGKVYYLLGFHNLYQSWWFILLLLMIGVSLVICSIDRVIPLYRALNQQRIPRSLNFYKRQRFYTANETVASALDMLEEALKKKRYKIKRTEEGILAEKGRISRWGPYINHIGLIMIILSVMLRLIPGFYLDERVWVWEGETKQLPGTDYYLKNEDFKLEVYNEDEFPQKLDIEEKVVKNYQTDAILFEKVNGELKEVHADEIRVNHPLEYQGLFLYQASYQLNQLYALKVKVMDKEKKQVIGEIELNLYDPLPEFDLGNGYTVKVLEYYPDFDLNERKEPYSKSRNPNRPAFVLQVFSPDHPEGEKGWMIAGFNADELTPDNRFGYELADFVLKDKTGLMVRIDRGLPVLYFSCAVVMIGLVLGFYFQHRRIWLRYEDGMLHLAAHTNKNWFGLRKEIEKIVSESNIGLNIANMDQGGKRK